MKIKEADTEICKSNEVAVISCEPVLGIFMDGDHDIPEWLLIELLIRLPVKLIFRFKIVCKHWLSLISDPSFVRMYISRASLLHQSWVIVSHLMTFDCSKHLDFFQYESVKDIYSSSERKYPSYLLLPPPPCTHQPQRENFRIYGISNGLVLYGQNTPNPTAMEYNICNPVTGQRISLPPLNCRSEEVHEGFLTQVEDGMLKSFRVVCLDWSFARMNMTVFHVFFSESCEWKDFCVSSDIQIEIMVTRPPTDLHGNLHWILDKNGVLSYDPYEEPDGFRIIALPGDNDLQYNQPGQNRVWSLCGVSNGKLRYFELCGALETPHGFSSFGVWILNDYSSGDWSLQHKISCFDILCDPVLCSLNSFILPISFDPFDLDIVYLGYRNVIVSYNIKTKRLEAHGRPLSNEEIIEHDRNINYCQLPWWMGMLFLIPPWPTTVLLPPSDLSRNDKHVPPCIHF